LTEQHVFWQVPKRCLHHVKVPAAHTVHEGGQEVCCSTAVPKKNTFYLGQITLFDMKDNTLRVPLQQHLQPNIPKQRINKWISSQTTRALSLDSYKNKQRNPRGVSILILPRVVLDAAQGQAEGHGTAQLLSRTHQSPQVILRAGKAMKTCLLILYRVVQQSVCVCVGGLFVHNKGVLLEGKLTVKYWMISGFLLDLSSTSVRTSSTSETQRGAKCW
jgi:hypothetical protein